MDDVWQLAFAITFVKYILLPVLSIIAVILVVLFIQAVIGVKETSDAVGNDLGRFFDEVLDRMFAPYRKPKHWAEVDRWFLIYHDHWYHKWLRRRN